MTKHNLEFEHYGESLESHPDFLLLKKRYEEELMYEELMLTECGKLCEENGEKHLEINKHSLDFSEQTPNFDIPLKENIPLKQPTNNEENVL